MSAPSTPAPRSVHWLWPLLLALGSLTVTIAWILVALATASQAGWMAVVAGVEAAWMLRLSTLPGGPLRVGAACAATLLMAVCAQWGIIAANLGRSLGLDIWESALRLGPHLAWTLAGLANGALELAMLGAGLLVAWWLAR